MRIFNFFKKENKVSSGRASENGPFGPTYLDGLIEHIPNPKSLDGHE